MELRLDMLPPGRHAYVTRVELEGALAARLADLGLVSGTRVDCELVSPAGDPAAYRVRGTLLALRRRDAAGIRVLPPGQEENG